MTIVKKYETLLFSSDVNSGALNVQNNGSSFTVQLDRPISIPRNAITCDIEVLETKIWNVNPNVSAEIGNNTLFLTIDGNPYQVVFPDGLYTLSNFEETLKRGLINLGFDGNSVVITGDNATQTLIFSFSIDNIQLDFTQGGLNELLGVNSRLLPLTPQISPYSEPGDNVASFNRTQSYVISTDLVSSGIPINSTSGGGVISISPILVDPGFISVFQPINPSKISADELIGQSKSGFNFRLTDQLLRPVDTRSEIYTITIQICYAIESDVRSLKEEDRMGIISGGGTLRGYGMY